LVVDRVFDKYLEKRLTTPALVINCSTFAELESSQNSIFNIHVPPYGSTLDDVPELTEDLKPMFGGHSLVPVGSHAVRDIIKEYQPLLGLFGHIHEGKGAIRIGRTLCVNPGSMYEQGR